MDAQELTIKDEDLSSLKGQVVVITGGSSGIGLATVEALLKVEALVVNGDLNPPPTEHNNLSFVKTNVTSWEDLKALFKHAQSKHGRIDHVFSNAGVGTTTNYMDETFDDNGELLEPTFKTLEINLRGMINTSYLALHHMRHQEPAGGSIVVSASASSFQRFRTSDYTIAKHGVLGFMRGVVPNLLDMGVPIRVNAVAPGWTETGLVPQGALEAVGSPVQKPEAPARSAVYLMADTARQGQLIFSEQGRFWEVEEQVLLPAAQRFVEFPSDKIMQDLQRLFASKAS